MLPMVVIRALPSQERRPSQTDFPPLLNDRFGSPAAVSLFAPALYPVVVREEPIRMMRLVEIVVRRLGGAGLEA